MSESEGLISMQVSFCEGWDPDVDFSKNFEIWNVCAEWEEK